MMHCNKPTRLPSPEITSLAKEHAKNCLRGCLIEWIGGVSVLVIAQYRKDRIVHPMAKLDPRLDPKLSRAATIAEERAHAHSKSRCWHYVKEALVASGLVSSYPKTSLAKEAGDELVRDFGFKKLPIRDPYSAPIGSVLVYFKGRNRP